ncbi:hypothetical protein GCM10009092_01370 [Bowmanella denitrificans]|uniref:PEP-CTERM system TPR-repeat protein PrsT n=1 Tax=Bowmanella denitrificans TaxID=366582 RepID=A0ABP3GBD4_9ALTE
MKRIFVSFFSFLFVWAVQAQDASSFYESAVKYQFAGDLDKAEIELKNSLQLDPEFLPARVLLGKVLLEGGKALAADKELSFALSRQADPRTVILSLVRAKLLQSQYTEAQALLTDHPQLQDSAEYFYLRGLLGLEKGHKDNAEQDFHQALALDSRHVESLTALANIALSRDALQDAETWLEQALKEQPEHFPALLLRAQLYRMHGQTEQAAALYDHAMAAKPANEQAMLGKASLLVDDNQLAAALQLVQQFREQHPDNPYAKLMHSALVAQQGDDREARHLLTDIQHQLSAIDDRVRKLREVSFLAAVVDYASGKLDSALIKFDDFIHTYGATAAAHRYLAMIALQQHNLKEAKRQVDKSLALSGQDPDVFVLAVTINQADGDLAAALQMADKGRQRFPAHQGLLDATVQVLIADKQFARALELLKQQQGEDIRSRTLLGFLQLQNGMLEDAHHTTQALLNDYPGKVEILQLAGELSLRQGQTQQAEAFFNEILRLAPEFNAAQLALAGIYLNQGKLDKVESSYIKLLQRNPQDATTAKLYADLAIQLGRADKAMTLLESIKDQQDEQANQVLLELYIQQQRWTDANTLLEQMIRKRNLDEKLLYTRARLEEAQGLKDKAISTLKALYGLAYDDPVKLHSVAHKQIDLAELGGAEKTLNRLKTLLGEQVDIYLQARMAMAKGQADKAISILDKGLTSSPDNARWLELKAYALRATGDLAQAQAIVQTLYQQQPLRGHMQTLASLYTENHQTDQALTLLKQWLREHPQDSWAVAQLSHLAMQSGDQALAIDTLKTYPQLQDSPVFLNNLAYYLIDSDLNQALAYAKRANELAPQVAQFNDTLGWIYAKSGQPQQALPLLREAQVRDNDNAQILYHLAYTLALLGEIQQAESMLKKAQQLAEEADLTKQVLAILTDNQP